MVRGAAVIAVVFVAGSVWPLVAVALVLGLGAGVACTRRAQRRLEAALGPRAEALAGRPAHGALRGLAAVLAAGLGGVVLLQPAWGLAGGVPAGADVILCLDASRSMAARDVLPSRWQAAQRQIAALADGALGARLGLVVFAGEARLAVPLTGDVAAVAELAAALAPGAVERGGTDPGAAIDLALQALQRSGATRGSIVVLGDGEDFAGDGPAAAARARAAGAVVHCLGFGREAASKIVVETAAGQEFLRAANGQDVLTRLERAQLDAVARAGGGRSAVAAADGDLRRWFREEMAPRAVAAAVHAGAAEPAHGYAAFLCAAILCWMLRTCLPERRRCERS
ncbi:MAG: VWA domain-containing protein [Planctomycetes bacterium]|nr:VWA domain-containing protein [Planctomycetota bacterium]